MVSDTAVSSKYFHMLKMSGIDRSLIIRRNKSVVSSNFVAIFLLTTRIAEDLVVNIKSLKAKKLYS